ncbi:hypothetical protein FNV43_RR21186 [Rhamnella rubrinervis]|uniref:Pentatricopeptide repeat-containing protein n=1 Tax=Rhamnella rubrinervis TaxID=2594499 RepID=A0A8K0E2M8_9ROSA|nr:hypothetical protein FNV43_RR21186 [Rhamnella rubrinervis]
MQLHCLNLKRPLPLYLWNLKIRDYINAGLFSNVVNIYASMFQSGLHGNNFTFPLVFKACANLPSLGFAIQLHSHVIRVGFQADVFVQTALVDVYASCFCLGSSRQLFDEMPIRSLVTWNSMISAYSRAFQVNEAFMLLKAMGIHGIQPSSSTFVSILSGCCDPAYRSLCQGLTIHSCAIKLGLTNSDIPLANSLISMYLHFRQVDGARFIFDNIEKKSLISWTTIIGGYVRVGNVGEGFCLLNQMRQTRAGLDSVMFVILVSGCGRERNILLASSVHSLILKSGSDNGEPINNLLVAMYANCGDLVSARKIFDMAHERSIFLWTSLIGGYTHLGYPTEALNLFYQLLVSATRPTGATIAVILSACADLGSLSMGKDIEEYILMNGLESDTRVQTSLIHMFCRCGCIKKAREVFDRVSTKDLVVWSSMITGYATHGMGKDALSLFCNMQSLGVKPDSVVYTSVLMACSHSGLVADGLKYFHSMQKDFGIEPTSEHYTCLVDLLGRAGLLNLALKIIQEMPVQVQVPAWGSLLSACRTYCNIELGEFVAEKLLNLNTERASNCVLMANLYTSVGKWKEAAMTRKLIKKQQLVKERGWSQVEINGSLHFFVAGDQAYPHSVDIYKKLEGAER